MVCIEVERVLVNAEMFYWTTGIPYVIFSFYESIPIYGWLVAVIAADDVISVGKFGAI